MKFEMDKESFADYIERFLREFPNDRPYAVWGCAEPKFSLVSKACPTMQYVVDNDTAKQGCVINGIVVEKPEDLIQRKTKVIVAVTDFRSVFTQLRKFGFAETDYCRFEEFLMLKDFAENQICLQEATIQTTNRCNLKCRACAVSVPYQKQQRVSPYSEVEQSLAHLFQYVNTVGSIRFSGGEVFLEQDLLCKLLKHVSEVYDGRYEFCSLTTNGTILPKDSCLEVLQKYRVRVTISDYKEQIGERSRAQELVHLFKERGITYRLERMFTRVGEGGWFDMGNGAPSHKSEDTLRVHFRKCTTVCALIYRSKLYNCPTLFGAGLSRDYHETTNDYFDLSKKPEDKADYLRFMKYALGYCDKGYYNWCDCCNGFGTVLNQTTVAPGEQM